MKPPFGRLFATRALVLSAVIASLFNNCASPYAGSGPIGGYSDTQLAPDIFRITFSGNGFTPSERAQDFALLRAADVALGHGFGYFAIIDSTNGGSVSSITLPGSSYTTASVTGYGNTAYGSAYTTYSPPTEIPVFKPETGLLIRCFPQRPPAVYVFDANFLSGSIRAKYRMAVKSPPSQIPKRQIPPAARPSQKRRLVLTDIRTGETCYGGFNLAKMSGWVTLPEGIQLTGNLSGHSDATTTNQGTQGEGSALLVNSDSTKRMTVHVVSDGLVMHGHGEGTMDDGRRFRIRW